MDRVRIDGNRWGGFLVSGRRKEGLSYLSSGIALIILTIYFSGPVYRDIVRMRRSVQFFLGESHYKSQALGGRGEWDWGTAEIEHYRLVYEKKSSEVAFARRNGVGGAM